MRIFLRHSIYICITLALALAFTRAPFLFADDPPAISNVRVTSTTEHTATILWETDKDADSLINFGKQPHYGITRSPGADKQIHELTLDDLDASTIYHFRVSSADALGNQAVSGDFVFTTSGFQDIENIEQVATVEQQTLVGQAQDVINQITDPEALKIVQEALQGKAEDILEPPDVIGEPRAVDITSNSATIVWATSRESNSIVEFAAKNTFGSTGQYTQTQAVLDENVLDHRVTLSGLSPQTVYHFKVRSEDTFGLSGESGDHTFETRSPLPQVEIVDIIKIEADSATFAWSTDMPAAGAVEYENVATGEIRSEGSPEFLSSHTVRLTDLTLGATYVAVVRASNAQGESTLSDPITFTTTIDEEEPIISRVNNESTLFPGAETRIQTIITWGTDEPSFCELHYSQGLVSAGTEPRVIEAPMEPATDHVRVVTEFLPSTVYKFWLLCEDLSGNEAQSEDFVLFTPEKEKSIIDIILENFEGTFGWVKNIGG